MPKATNEERADSEVTAEPVEVEAVSVSNEPTLESGEPNPAYRDPNLTYLIYKGYADAFVAEDDTILNRGVPTGVKPELATKILFHYRKTTEFVKE
jgi:hypothetical protein